MTLLLLGIFAGIALTLTLEALIIVAFYLIGQDTDDFTRRKTNP